MLRRRSIHFGRLFYLGGCGVCEVGAGGQIGGVAPRSHPKVVRQDCVDYGSTTMKLTDLVTDVSEWRSVSVTVSTYSPVSRSEVSRAVYSASSAEVPRLRRTT